MCLFQFYFQIIMSCVLHVLVRLGLVLVSLPGSFFSLRRWWGSLMHHLGCSRGRASWASCSVTTAMAGRCLLARVAFSAPPGFSPNACALGLMYAVCLLCDPRECLFGAPSEFSPRACAPSLLLQRTGALVLSFCGVLFQLDYSLFVT